MIKNLTFLRVLMSLITTQHGVVTAKIIFFYYKFQKWLKDRY